MRQDKVGVSLAFIQGMKQQATLSLNQSKESVAQHLVRLLAEKGYRVLAKSDPGEVTVYATKGIMGRVGAHVAHLSATVIVLGGLTGKLLWIPGIWGLFGRPDLPYPARQFRS